MRIAVVLNTSWNIHNFRMGLVKTLQNEHHEVIAIAPRDEYSPILEENGCEFVPVKMDSRGINPFKDLALLFELFFIYKKHKPDLVLHYTIKPNIYGTMAARMIGIPVVNNVCGLGTAFIQKNALSKIAQILYKFAFQSSNTVFFQNEEDRKFFENKGIVKKAQAETLPGSGIDPEKFSPRKRGKGKFTFLMISRLIHDKGVLEYVAAVKALRSQNIDARFQILGPIDTAHRRGIPKELIDSWIDNQEIEYLGKTEDVIPYLSASDCVVLPSYREGTPRTLIEAASMAKPIVASNVAGCTNIVKDGTNGLLCKVKDSEDLALKMKKIIGMPLSERQKMGASGREMVVSSFDERIVITKYLNVIGRLTAQN
jgi:glycosyltransferase involved in cell wall biosynthesis